MLLTDFSAQVQDEIAGIGDRDQRGFERASAGSADLWTSGSSPEGGASEASGGCVRITATFERKQRTAINRIGTRFISLPNCV